jgi:curved DNA-binding protein CbpA
MDHLLSGRVAERPFPKVLYALFAREFTGALILEHEGKSWTVWWKAGAIVDADSATPDDTLGRVLVAEGAIDAAKLSDLLRRMAQNPEKKPLELLVEARALEGEHVARAARLGLVARARRIFGLPEAEYRCEPEEHARGEEGAALDPRWLVYRGLRAHYDAARLGRELAPLESYAMKLDPGHEAALGVFGFGDEERYVLAYLAKGYWCLPDLADACIGLPVTTVHALVYALLACELLDVKPATTVPRLRKRPREETLNVGPAAAAALGKAPPLASGPVASGTVRPGAASGSASIPPPPAPTVPPAIVRPSTGTTGTLPTMPVTTLSGVPTVTPAAAAAAKAARASGPIVASTPPAAASPEVREQIMKKFRDAEAAVDHFKMLEVAPTATSADIKASYFKLAKTFHPDRLASLRLEELRPQVERVFARISEAFSIIGDDARRAEYKKVLAAGGEEAVRRREEEDQAKAMKILGAEEHFRLGEMALRRQQFDVALEEFRLAIDGNPEEAEHHAYYAWAMWMGAADKDRALAPVKQVFARALEVNPRCVPAYFYLGHVYNYQQDYPRALAQFQRALDLRPGYVDAEREIRLLQMRREKSGGTLAPGKSSSSLNPFRKK